MFNWLKKKELTKKSNPVGGAIFSANRQPTWSERKDAAFADEGFSRNVVVYQAIEKRAKAVATIEWTVTNKNGKELDNHPMLELINNPNIMQSRAEFITSLMGFYGITGNGYMSRVMVNGVPKELWVHRSDRTTVIPSSEGIPRGYIYKAGDIAYTFDVDYRTGDSDMRHIKTFNPLHDWLGLSPLAAAAYSVDQHNEAACFVQSLLQNGAAPSGVLTFENEDISNEDYNRIKAEVDEKYTGSRNAGKPMLLGKFKWQSIGISPVDMSIIEIKNSSARDISLALGVPPLLLNIPGDSTYSNYKEARLAFYEETVIPLAEMLRDELNAWLSPLFDGAKLGIDIDKIPAITEKRRELWEMADKSTDLTINERREIKGYDAIDGGDSVLVSSAVMSLEMAVEPIPDQDEIDDAKMVKSWLYGKTIK